MSDPELPILEPDDEGRPEPTTRRRPDRSSYSRSRQRLRAKRLEVGSVIGSTFSIWFGNLLPFSALAVLLHLPLLAIVYLFWSQNPTGPQAFWFGIITIIVNAIFFQQVLTGTVTYGVVMQLRGKRAGIARCVTVGLSRFFHVLAVGFIVGVLCGAAFVPVFLLALADVAIWPVFGFAALIVFLVLICRFYVAVPAVIIEDVGIVNAVSRSSALTKGSRLTIFGILILMGILLRIMQVPLDYILKTVAQDLGPEIYITTSYGLSILLTPITAIIAAVVYHDLRVGKEGVDVEDLAAVFE